MSAYWNTTCSLYCFGLLWCVGFGAYDLVGGQWYGILFGMVMSLICSFNGYKLGREFGRLRRQRDARRESERLMHEAIR